MEFLKLSNRFYYGSGFSNFIYETGIENVYLTNYDIINDCLLPKDTWSFVTEHTNDYLLVSTEVFKNDELFKLKLNEFLAQIKRLKVIVAVCVYNRFNNIKRWINCWQNSNTENAELIIVHNFYGDQSELTKYKKYCDDQQIKYVARNGPGFDIGAFQDVCKERLNEFPNDWNYLLWCTDDCIPMSKDFITPFIEKIQEPGVGISCMQLSRSVSNHIRTTGFCIGKETSLKITFPFDPITTKAQCYFFEHRGGTKTFTNQILSMGLSCEAVAHNEDSPLWDMGYHRRLDRMAEHDKVFGTAEVINEKVVFISPIFDAFPEIISSLICQSNKNWELLLIDDNPQETICKAIVEVVKDSRIKYIKREREANYGHPHRRWALNELKENRLSDASYVVVTNADNWYTPNFITDMLNGFKKSHTVIATYSQKMVHSYKNWDVINCKLERGYLDCGGVMVKKDIACEIGWSDITSHSSDWTYFEDIIKQYGTTGFISIPGALFTHN